MEYGKQFGQPNYHFTQQVLINSSMWRYTSLKAIKEDPLSKTRGGGGGTEGIKVEYPNTLSQFDT